MDMKCWLARKKKCEDRVSKGMEKRQSILIKAMHALIKSNVDAPCKDMRRPQTCITQDGI